jgi:hypothetical protein
MLPYLHIVISYHLSPLKLPYLPFGLPHLDPLILYYLFPPVTLPSLEVTLPLPTYLKLPAP